jgi:hypothetical protein
MSAMVEARLDIASEARKKRVEEMRMLVEVGQGVLCDTRMKYRIGIVKINDETRSTALNQ